MSIITGLCVDKRKYPTGSARVCFNNNESFMKAVTAEYVNLKTPKFSKTVSAAVILRFNAFEYDKS
jgi:hypothetical protein